MVRFTHTWHKRIQPSGWPNVPARELSPRKNCRKLDGRCGEPSSFHTTDLLKQSTPRPEKPSSWQWLQNNWPKNVPGRITDEVLCSGGRVRAGVQHDAVLPTRSTSSGQQLRSGGRS